MHSEGRSVEPSYYKKPVVTPVPSRETVEAAVVNRFGLAHVESTKIAIKFRELCYETVERALSSLFQGTHKSLATEYFSRLGADGAPPLSKAELDVRYADLMRMRIESLES